MTPKTQQGEAPTAEYIEALLIMAGRAGSVRDRNYKGEVTFISHEALARFADEVRAASRTSDQQYWVDRRPQIIEALAAEGWEIWSDKDRVWLHRVPPALREPVEMSVELPPLPEAQRIHPEAAGRYGYVAGLGYTADQMRDYARRAILAGGRK